MPFLSQTPDYTVRPWTQG